MKSKWRVLPQGLFLVVSLALIMSPLHATGTAVAATSGQAPREPKRDGANDGTYDVTLNPSTCSDGLSKTKASALKLTVDGQTVSLVSASNTGPTRTGQVSADGSFTISGTLSDGSVVTMSGTFNDGHVEGTSNSAFASGLSCTPTFSGQRAGAKTVDPVDELIDELGLDEVFEEYEDFCDGRSSDCPTLEKSAGDFADLFTAQFCPPEGCNQKGLSTYQRALPDLVSRAQLLAGAGGRFPSVKAAMPVLLRMAFHGATDSDPVSARQAASAAWRLFATLANIDYQSPST